MSLSLLKDGKGELLKPDRVRDEFVSNDSECEKKVRSPAFRRKFVGRRKAKATNFRLKAGLQTCDDKRARREAVAANWNCFGAPAGLFCYIDREMGAAQWADIGMYLQTIMLLLRAEGLHSCPQMAWSVYRRTVAEIVSPPDELMLFCGMSIGYEDTSKGHVRIDRAPLGDTVTFLD